MQKLKFSALVLFSALFVTACGTTIESSSDSPSNPPSTSSNEDASSEQDNSSEEVSSEEVITSKIYHYAATAPTCTVAGNLECWINTKDGTIYLTRPSGSNIKEAPTFVDDDPTKPYYIAPLGHDLEFAGYTWNSEYSEATANYRCKRSGCGHLASFDAHVHPNIITEPTCTEEGSKTYTASYEKEDPETTDPIAIPATGHHHVFDHFDWNDDDLSKIEASAIYVCDHQSCDHSEEHKAVVSHYSTKQKGCFVSEEKTYKATYDGETDYHNVVTEVVEGHIAASIHIGAKEANCTVPGNIEYWYCPSCHQYYNDSALENNIPQVDTVIPVNNNHVWDGGTVTIEPTIASVGEMTYHCTLCTEVKTEPIAPIGHTHDFEELVVPPTCTEAGYTRHTCKAEICNHYSYDDSEVAALGHNYVPDVTNPTCTAGGYTTYTCSRCSDHYIADETEALGHSYTKVTVVPPTCIAQGYTIHTCSRCDSHYEDTYVDMIAHSWNEGEIIVEPTEISGGTKKYTCTVCGATKNEDIDPLGHTHTYGSGVVTSPTCTTAGYTTYTCTSEVCNHHSYTANEVAALGHDLGEWIITTPATCTNKGVETRYCSRCDHTETREIAATGHNYVPVVTPPTCTATGYTTYTCSKCGDHYISNETAALGHDYSNVTVIPATCTTDGYTIHTCSRCGDHYEDTPVIATGHSYAYVHDEEGHEYKCSVCGDVESSGVHIPAAPVNENVVPVTCTTDGSHDEVVYCSVCGYEISRTPVEDIAQGHKWDTTYTTDDNYHWYACENCTEMKEVGAHRHVEKDVVISEATCTEDGSHWHIEYCDVCDKEFSKEKITDYAKGHGWVGPTLTWKHNHAVLDNVKICEKCKETEITEHVYTRANRDFVTISGSASEAAGDLDFASYKGDVNICFDNDGDNGTPFQTSMVLRINHEGDFASASDVLIVKVDNGAGYSTTRNTGDDRVVFKSDYTAYTDSNSGGYTIDENDFGNNKKDFKADEFRHFMQKALVYIDVKSEVISKNESHLTIKITYYTMLEEEGASEYMGYTQQVNAVMGSDTSWNDFWRGSVHAVRVIRPTSSAASTTYNFEIIDNVLGTAGRGIFDKDGTRYSVSTDHNIQLVEAKAPTCLEEGNIAYYECTTPGHSDIYSDEEGANPLTIDNVKLPALGHELSHFDAEEPTCSKEGNVEFWCCNVCHKCYLDKNATIEATSEEIVLDSLPHTYGDWTITQDSTCSTPGTKERTCSACGHVDKGVVETKPHTYTGEPFLEWYNDGLYETEECNVCHYHHHTTTIVPAYTSSTSYKATENSSLASSEGQDRDADYNVSFDNDRTNGSEFGFKLTLNIKHDAAISSMENNFWMKIGSDKIYQFNPSGNRSGNTRTVFYTNLTGKGTNNSNSLTSKQSYNDKYYFIDANDNRNDYTPKGSSFEEDYCQFTKDCTYVFDVDYSFKNETQTYGTGKYGYLTVKITYYTKVEGYERYLGYTQTYTARMRYDEINYSNYNTFRIVRLKDDFSTTITAYNDPAGLVVTKGTLKTQSGRLNPYFTNDW